MTTRKARFPKPPTLTEQALAIYLAYVKRVEDGTHDESVTFRQAVLDEYRESLSTSEASLAGLYIVSQKTAGVRVNKYFEIERAELPTQRGSANRQPIRKPVSGTSKVLTLRTTDPAELTLVPKQGPVPNAPTPMPTAAPSTTASSPVAGPGVVEVPAKRKAEKIHADLIDLCEDEIAEAFLTLEELIDNVDQSGDAKVLRKFARAIRAACKRIEDQLDTKAILDKRQAQKILPGLQSGAK
jgi:hypothetical protein